MIDAVKWAFNNESASKNRNEAELTVSVHNITRGGATIRQKKGSAKSRELPGPHDSSRTKYFSNHLQLKCEIVIIHLLKALEGHYVTRVAEEF